MSESLRELTVRIPMRLPVLPNLRKSRFAHARVVRGVRQVVGLELLAQARSFLREWRSMAAKSDRLRLQVTQVRFGPVRLDDDNCTGSFKPVRDELARFFGIDDGRLDRWVWLPCEQQRGDYAVRIHLAVVETHEGYPTLRECGRIERRIKKSRITPNVVPPRKS